MAAVLILALAFYMWTAGSSITFTFPSVDQDLYNELTTAFLHGHTYLPITPPPGLLHLADPYNPVQNAPYNAAYHDLSLFHGHFYSQWGPTPVLTLFAPFRITGLRMSESFAAALYAFVGLVCSVLLLRALLRRFVPSTPPWVLPVSTVGLTLTNTLPFLLRRPVQYEVAIACGYCFEMAGLWLMVTSVLGDELRRWRMLLGSLCLGLAVGGRPTLAVGGVVALAIGAWELRRRTGTFRPSLRNGSLRIFAYALGPFIACGILLALYNQLRFGSFTDFGDRYELAGIDQTTAKFYGLSYIVPGLLSYLVVPARLALTFPYAFLQTAASDPIISLPHGYIGSATGPAVAEPAAGVFTAMPITLLLFSLPWLWRRRRDGDRGVLLAATGLALLGLLVAGLLSYALFATTQRYEVDFVSLLLVPAFLVWAVLLARHRQRTGLRRTWAVVGVVLTAFGCFVGIAMGLVGYSNLLELEHPGVFNALEDITSPLPTLATMLRSRPELARVDNGQLSVSAPPGATEAGATVWLGAQPATLVVVSPGSQTANVTAIASAGPGAPAVSTQVIEVRSPGGKPAGVPVIAPSVRLPLKLHWGLNRIRVMLAHPSRSPQELALSNLQITG